MAHDVQLSAGRAAVARGLLLERDRELRAVDEVVRWATASSRGALLVVEGPAGIGKTRLLRAAGELARVQEMQVLWAAASELERALPFGVALQLFEAPLARLSGAEWTELLSGAAALAEGLFGEARRAERPDPARALSLVHGLYWLTSNLADRAPLLILADDAHWADPPSLEFLLYLVRRIDGLPVVVALSWRSGELASPEALLAELCVGHRTRVLRPAPLSLRAVRELVLRRLPSAREELCRACADATGGNPFLVEELLRGLEAEPVPSSALTPQLVSGLAQPRFVAR